VAVFRFIVVTSAAPRVDWAGAERPPPRFRTPRSPGTTTRSVILFFP